MKFHLTNIINVFMFMNSVFGSNTNIKALFLCSVEWVKSIIDWTVLTNTLMFYFYKVEVIGIYIASLCIIHGIKTLNV